MKGTHVAFLLFFALSAVAIPADERQRMDVIYFPADTGSLQLPKRTELSNEPQNLSAGGKPTYDSSVTSFAWKLFQGSKLANPADNLVLSPLILQYLLAILETSAEGETKAQLRNVIGIPDARRWLPLFNSPGKSVQLEAASGFFLDATQTLNPKFVDYVRSLGSEIASVDFKKFPDDSRNIINRWASQATHGTIDELLSPGYDVRQIELVIASAIYFHSPWKYHLKPANPETFYTYVGLGKPAEFMEVKQNFVLEHIDLGHGIQGDVIEIPYESDTYSMLIILPSANVTLDEFIKKLDVATLEKIIKATPERLTRPVTLRMPKFKIKSHFSLVNALLKMGVVDLFTQQSRLPYIGLGGDNRVSDIIQEATLMVDENGTVASAATTSFLIPLSAVVRQDIVFTVNKPFLSIIIDKINQIPLFISKIYQPIY